MTLAGTSSQSMRTETLRLAVLLLAAGEGSRLGGFPKALLTKDGKSLLEHFCLTMKALEPVELVIVTGYHHQAIEAEVLKQSGAIGLPVKIVRHTNPERGQVSSVRLGLESLQSDFDVLAVALSDQPNMGVGEWTALLSQFAQRKSKESIVLPQVQGQRGNPVLFSKAVIDAIRAIPAMVCRPYMDQHPELVRLFETANTAYVLDADTEADIQKLGIAKSR